jgi:hypothetical protein
VVLVHEAGAGESNTWTTEESLMQLPSPPQPEAWTAKVSKNYWRNKEKIFKFTFHIVLRQTKPALNSAKNQTDRKLQIWREGKFI